MEPELFNVKPSIEEQAEYGSAVRFGYEEMDQLIGRFMNLAGNDTTLIFCTALSQQPCLKYEHIGGAYFHRPRDFEAVARFAGISTSFKAAPVMTHQFHLDFDNESAAADAERKLLALRCPSGPALQIDRTGSRIFTGCQIYTRLANDVRLSVAGSNRSVPFFALFYCLDTMKSRMHHPEGMLWIRTPQRHHSVSQEKVPLAMIAPMILKMFDVPCPEHMKTDSIVLSAGTTLDAIRGKV